MGQLAFVYLPLGVHGVILVLNSFESSKMSSYQHILIMYEKCTDKKENKIFLIYKEIQMGAVARSYMRKGFLMYEELRRYFVIYEEAISHMTLQPLPSGFPIRWRKFDFFFISDGFVNGNQTVYFGFILTIKTAI